MIEIIQSEGFAEWLVKLKDRRAKARVYARLDRIAEGNWGDVEPIGDGLSEARIHYGPGYRLYFMRRGDSLVVLLCGGDKATQQRDIQRAKVVAEIWKGENP